MSYDVLIRGGHVIDGSGRARFRVDVGVAGDRVEAVGVLPTAEAEIVIDGSGKIVAPGFIDVHTHYDAQVFWDGALTPSPLHGITSVVNGNCGFSIAPLSGRPEDAAYLLRMLARVEGMPTEALQQGVPWDWQSMGEYLRQVEPSLAVNAGFMAGHSAIRRCVMGAESVRREASSEERRAMCDLLQDQLEAGAIGFSSSWARSHNDAEGNRVPSRCASRDELVALSAVLRRVPGTSLEFIPMNGMFEPWAVELMADMSVAADRWLNWNVLSFRNKTRAAAEEQLAYAEGAAARGGRVVALTMPFESDNRMTFESGFGYDAIPGWEEPMHLDKKAKMALLSSSDGRRELKRLAASPANPFPRLAEWRTQFVFQTVAPDNAQFQHRTIGEVADERGRDPWDVLCDIVVADELQTSFGTVAPELDRDAWTWRIQVGRDRRALVGASDAGAHVVQLANFNYPTVILGEAVRRFGVLTFEEAIHLLSTRPAHLYELKGRGTLSEGAFADLVVLDPTTVGSEPVCLRQDLPGGASRLYAAGVGIDHVLVNGVPIVDNGRLTGATPGTVLRSLG